MHSHAQWTVAAGENWQPLPAGDRSNRGISSPPDCAPPADGPGLGQDRDWILYPIQYPRSVLNRQMPGKLARKTTQEAVAGALREAISLGDLPHGTRLTQDDLAAQFGVSRIPIREALWQL